ncbi:hypothetical protein IJ750_06870 [bacterium]|nr:hypothetical protein [bacterium]
MKKILAVISLFLITLSVQAREDCIISNPEKLTDIKIEHNDVIDVFPLVTIMNEKNTLIVHPLKEGASRFIVTKGGKEKVVFNVKVEGDSTIIDEIQGFEILTIDCPPGYFEYEYELDEPPLLKERDGE